MKNLFKFKKSICIFLILCISLSFTGCFSGEQDIKNTTVLQGIGIDYDEEKDEYKLTVEIFDISHATGMGEAEAGNLTKLIEVSGSTVSGAVEKITLEIGKSLIYSQERVLVIGETALEKGLSNITDFFIREYKTRGNLLVAVADNCTAADIMKADEGNISFPARELQVLLESGDVNGYTTAIDIATVTELTKDDTSSVFIPCLGIKEEDESKYAYLSGFEILKNDKPVGKLSLSQGRGMLFINDDINGGIITIKNEKIGLATLKIVKSSTRIGVDVDSTARFTVNIDCTADITEVQDHSDASITNKDAEIIGKEAEKYVNKIVSSALEKCLDDYSADVFGMTRRVWILHPSYYRANKDSMEKNLTSDKVKVNVDFKVRRIGQGNM